MSGELRRTGTTVSTTAGLPSALRRASRRIVTSAEAPGWGIAGCSRDARPPAWQHARSSSAARGCSWRGGRPSRTRLAPRPAAGQLEQVRPDGIEPVVAPQPRVVEQRVEQSPGRLPGRRTIATATAWLSVTTGPGAKPSSMRVEDLDLRPVGVLGGRRRLGMDGGDRRLQLEGPDRARRQRRPRRAPRPRAIVAAVPPRAVLLGQRNERSRRRRMRAARRASVSSISASSPATSPALGQAARGAGAPGGSPRR